MSNPREAIVVGAGISGLVLAYRLMRQGHRVTVLEAAARPGGVVGSGRQEGILWESGPNSGMDTTPLINELLDALGIRDQRVDARAVADRRFIVRGGQLMALPTSGPAFFSTPLFSLGTKLGLLREPFIARSSPEIEETVAGFVRRRLGQEFLDYAIEPFVAGIFAGDPERLSVQAAFPKLFALEQRYGGLIRGLVLGAKERKRQREKSKNNAKSFSFKEGMQALTDALAAAIAVGGSLETGARVGRIERQATGGWTVTGARDRDSHQESFERRGDIVVLATPADSTAALITPFAADSAAALREIPYAPVSIAVAAWPRSAIAHPLDGFGFLSPGKENTQILGTLFSSTMFDHRAGAEHAVLTAFIGGMRRPELPARSDAELEGMVMEDLQRLIGVHAAPAWWRISRHPRAIPQYTMGHLERVRRAEAAGQAMPGLFFCANWRGGISVSDCIKSGHRTAEDVQDFLVRQR